MELVDYLEGGTRKVKITKFEVSPLGNKQANATPTPQNTAEPQTESDEQNAQNALAKAIFDPNEVLDLGMTVCMYSMNGKTQIKFTTSAARISRDTLRETRFFLMIPE